MGRVEDFLLGCSIICRDWTGETHMELTALMRLSGACCEHRENKTWFLCQCMHRHGSHTREQRSSFCEFTRDEEEPIVHFCVGLNRGQTLGFNITIFSAPTRKSCLSTLGQTVSVNEGREVLRAGKQWALTIFQTCMPSGKDQRLVRMNPLSFLPYANSPLPQTLVHWTEWTGIPCQPRRKGSWQTQNNGLSLTSHKVTSLCPWP